MFYSLPKSSLGCVILKTCKLGHQREGRRKRKASTEALYRINTQRPVGLVAGDLGLCTVTEETVQTWHAKRFALNIRVGLCQFCLAEWEGKDSTRRSTLKPRLSYCPSSRPLPPSQGCHRGWFGFVGAVCFVFGRIHFVLEIIFFFGQPTFGAMP